MTTLEKSERAEKLLSEIRKKEEKVKSITDRINATIMRCGPSGYVGCSEETRGNGLRRKSGSMEEIAEYIYGKLYEKDVILSEFELIADVFEKMSFSRKAHVLYYRIGKEMGTLEYAALAKISRRHARRLYISSTASFFDLLAKSESGRALLMQYDFSPK